MLIVSWSIKVYITAIKGGKRPTENSMIPKKDFHLRTSFSLYMDMFDLMSTIVASSFIIREFYPRFAYTQIAAILCIFVAFRLKAIPIFFSACLRGTHWPGFHKIRGTLTMRSSVAWNSSKPQLQQFPQSRIQHWIKTKMGFIRTFRLRIFPFWKTYVILFTPLLLLPLPIVISGLVSSKSRFWI